MKDKTSPICFYDKPVDGDMTTLNTGTFGGVIFTFLLGLHSCSNCYVNMKFIMRSAIFTAPQKHHLLSLKHCTLINGCLQNASDVKVLNIQLIYCIIVM